MARLAGMLLIVTGLVLAPVFHAHGVGSAGDASNHGQHDNHAHHHAWASGHTVEMAGDDVATESTGCCHLAVFCGAVSMNVVSEMPLALVPLRTRCAVPPSLEQESIGVAAEPPPPRT